MKCIKYPELGRRRKKSRSFRCQSRGDRSRARSASAEVHRDRSPAAGPRDRGRGHRARAMRSIMCCPGESRRLRLHHRRLHLHRRPLSCFCLLNKGASSTLDGERRVRARRHSFSAREIDDDDHVRSTPRDSPVKSLARRGKIISARLRQLLRPHAREITRRACDYSDAPTTANAERPKPRSEGRRANSE